MTQRAAFQTQLLEKIGAPLVAAVSDVASRRGESGDPDAKQDAEVVAALLGKAVKMGIDLSSSMDLKGAADDLNALHLALAAVASKMIAGHYRVTSKVPGDNDVQRLVKSMEAVLAFSDNFAPDDNNTQRLQALDGSVADESQLYVRYICALTPVSNAVAAFSFGRPENKLIQEIAGKLSAQATQLAGDGADALVKLSALEALSVSYTEAHSAETARLMKLDDAARAKLAEAGGGMLPMDEVWKGFELRAGMASALAESLAPGAGSAQSAPAPAVPAAPVAAEPAAEVPASARPAEEGPPVSPLAAVAAKSQPQEPAPADPPPAAPIETAAAQEPEAGAGDAEGGEKSGDYNPMGFFGAPKSSDDKEGD